MSPSPQLIARPTATALRGRVRGDKPSARQLALRFDVPPSAGTRPSLRSEFLRFRALGEAKPRAREDDRRGAIYRLLAKKPTRRLEGETARSHFRTFGAKAQNVGAHDHTLMLWDDRSPWSQVEGRPLPLLQRNMGNERRRRIRNWGQPEAPSRRFTEASSPFSADGAIYGKGWRATPPALTGQNAANLRHSRKRAPPSARQPERRSAGRPN